MKIKFMASLVGATVLASSLSGCCLTVDGKTQPVAIKTNAPALYTIRNSEGQEVADGVAPATVNLKRGDAPYTVSLRRTATSTPITSTINDNLNGWLWGDVLCGVIICGGVDLATGSAWDLDTSVTLNTPDATMKIDSPLNTLNTDKAPVTINNTINNKNG